MSNLFEASRTLKPLQQGECDSLCGVYAIINAIRLASYPREVDTQTLFDAAIDHLITKGRLAEVMRYGMGTAVWRRLLNHMVKHPSLPVSLHAVSISNPSVPREDLLRHALARGAPVLLELTGHCQHISVATQTTRTRLVLFDSDRMQWIRLKSINWTSEGQQTRYGVAPLGVSSVIRTRNTAVSDP